MCAAIIANGTHSANVKFSAAGRHENSAAGRNSSALKQEAYPQTMERLNWLIHSLHVRGELSACKELIARRISESCGRNEFALFKKGIILREEGKTQESLKVFQSCHKLNPTNVDNLKEIGKCLYQLKRYRLSLEAYLQAESTSGKSDWEICHSIGECCMRLKDIERAEEYLQKAVDLGHKEVSYNQLIKIVCMQGNWLQAVSISNAAVDSCPDSVDVLTKSGLLYLRVGETQHAFDRLSSALALDPANPKALLGFGCITQNHNEYDVALSKYKIAVQTDTDSVALWNNIGMCFFTKQKYIAAVTCLKRALWISPLNWKVLTNLGMVNLFTNQAASSFNFICAAVNVRPDLGRTFMILGCALMELQDSENADRALMQAFSLNPDDPLIALNTSLCAFLKGSPERASEILNSYKSLPDTHKTSEMNQLCERLDLNLKIDDKTETEELQNDPDLV